MITKMGIETLKDIWKIWNLEEPIDYFELCFITIGFVFILMFSLLLDICVFPIEIIVLIVYGFKKRWK